jgi:hypothetical protein
MGRSLRDGTASLRYALASGRIQTADPAGRGAITSCGALAWTSPDGRHLFAEARSTTGIVRGLRPRGCDRIVPSRDRSAPLVAFALSPARRPRRPRERGGPTLGLRTVASGALTTAPALPRRRSSAAARSRDAIWSRADRTASSTCGNPWTDRGPVVVRDGPRARHRTRSPCDPGDGMLASAGGRRRHPGLFSRPSRRGSRAEDRSAGTIVPSRSARPSLGSVSFCPATAGGGWAVWERAAREKILLLGDDRPGGQESATFPRPETRERGGSRMRTRLMAGRAHPMVRRRLDHRGGPDVQ